jgi:allophanate hydrolase subunit 2
LGQIKPGDAVRFNAVSLNEAQRALAALEEKLHKFEESLN